MLRFKLYEIYVKSAFLNGLLNEKVNVSQPPDFEDHEHQDYIFKLMKVLCGLKQALRSWYERLKIFLLEKGFSRGKVDNTLFSKRKGKDILFVQIYVDNIIFGSSDKSLCREFSKLMQG